MNSLIAYMFVIATINFTNGSVPLTKQKTFGHSIKNGKCLNEEIYLFLIVIVVLLP